MSDINARSRQLSPDPAAIAQKTSQKTFLKGQVSVQASGLGGDELSQPRPMSPIGAAIFKAAGIHEEAPGMATARVDALAMPEEREAEKKATTTIAGPEIRTVSEWNTSNESIASRLELNSRDVVAERAESLLLLMAALRDGSVGAIRNILQKIPANVKSFDCYFPPAPLVTGYAAILKGADAYNKLLSSTSSRRLVSFINDCYNRSDAMANVLRERQTQIEKEGGKTHVNAICAPELTKLCMVLRDTHELAVTENKAALVGMIHDVMKAVPQDLSEQLARQPYANLRMVLLKLKFLDGHMDKATLSRFERLVDAARLEQMHVSAFLKKELLNAPQTMTDKYAYGIARLARIEYAKEMSSLPIDYVSSGSSWEEIDKLKTNIQQVHEHYVRREPGFDIETDALRWLADQIERTSQQRAFQG